MIQVSQGSAATRSGDPWNL